MTETEGAEIMQLTFCGAARAVTGSCMHIQHEGYQLLIDCGLQQGQDVIDNNQFLFQPQQLDAVLLTHCHIDHCGRLPLLVKRGFQGPIFMTEPTAYLLDMMLRESADLQGHELRWRNQKNRRAGKPLQEPFFTLQDVKKTLQQIKICHYGQRQTLTKDLQFCFYDAGHILGSAMIALDYEEHGQKRRLLCSGDLGSRELPFVGEPQQLTAADTVVMECTHGDHCYWQQHGYQQALAQILQSTFQKQGSVIIPAAAIGRTQEVLYYLQQIKQAGLVSALPDFPVYVDNALAEEACAIYSGDYLNGYLDREALVLKKRCGALLNFPHLHLCTTTEQSRLLNQDHAPKVIIASGSTCDGGRIRHHLKHYLWRPQCTVVLLGNPRRGTLARALLDGAASVTLFGDEIAVQARVIALPVRPIHADQPALMQWLQQLQPPPEKIFLNHGDEETAFFLAELLQETSSAIYVPRYGDSFNLHEPKP